MKRDLDLIRTILLKIESSTDANIHLSLSPEELNISVANEEIVESHLFLMHDANLIELYYSQSGTPIELIKRITWNGYEYLDAVRSDEVWNKTKSVLQKVGSYSMDVVIKVTTQIIGDLIKGAIV